MNKANKYHVLWLDDDWDPNRPKYDELKNDKEDAEKLYPSLDFETCIAGKAFIERANDETIWDAFIIDVNVPMSIDEAESPRDVIASIVKGIATVVEKQKVLLYCFSGELNKNGVVPSEGMINGFLEEKGFAQNKITQQFFYLKDEAVELFSDLNKALQKKNGPFKDYPEIKLVYNIASDKGKKFIDKLLKWKNGDIQDLDCNNLRFVIKDVEDVLRSKGFFVEGRTTFHTYIIEYRKDNVGKYDGDLLKETCRNPWEAAAMNFLARYANSPMHVGENVVYDKLFENMIFDSFVIYSKWYVRFMKDFKNSGYNMGLYVNPDNSQQVVSMVGTISKDTKGALRVKGDDGVFYPIDWNDPAINQTWKGNERVSFTIAKISNSKTVARNVKIES